MKKILIVFGTRPEAIKCVPIIHELLKKSKIIQTVICTTGQHRELLEQVLQTFSIKPDYHLSVMTENQTLSVLTTELLRQLDTILTTEKPDLCVVQGDTTTAMVASLCSYYNQIPVAHVESGLRSHDLYQPFPEEGNRKIISQIAALNFAPTKTAYHDLLKENIDRSKIFLTGNTVVDALEMTKKIVDKPSPVTKKRIILVTAHRRENYGQPLRQICRALLELAKQHRDIEILFPLHLNPNIKSVVEKHLRNQKRITLLSHQSYFEFLDLMKRSYLILTDSGGLQEEAPSFHKPVLVLRNVTERPEGITAGVAKLVGTETKKIVEEVNTLLTNTAEYNRMVKEKNPYGDGTASKKIIAHILDYLSV